MTADLRALIEAVKPPEWDEMPTEGNAVGFMANTQYGRYHYGADFAGDFYINTPDGQRDGFPTLEAARAAAQADYAARILQSLTDEALAALRAKIGEGE